MTQFYSPKQVNGELAKTIHAHLAGWYYSVATARENGDLDLRTHNWLRPEDVVGGEAVRYSEEADTIYITDTYGVLIIGANDIRTLVLDYDQITIAWDPETRPASTARLTKTIIRRESRIPEPEDPETLEKVLDLARENFQDSLRYDTEVDGEDIYLPKENAIYDLISSLADSCVPVYNRDLLDVASSDMGILTDEPEFEVDGGVLDVIRVNIYTRIEQELHEYWEELQDMDPEELAHELDLELETEEEDQDEA